MTASSTDRIVNQIELIAVPERVWRALTDYREFSAWFKVTLESPFEVGKVTRGNLTYPGYEHLVMEVLVRRMERERVFAFNWHPYAIDPGVDYSKETPTLVEFTLERTKGGTLLTAVESGFDLIPAHRRDEAFRMNSQGWAIQVQNIAAHVAAMP